MTQMLALIGVDRPSTSIRLARSVTVLVLSVVVLVTIGEATNGHLSVSSQGAELVLGAVTTDKYIPAAITAVEEERERLRQERDAFDQFRNEVEAVTVSADNTGGVSPILVEKANAKSSALCNVRTAYQTSVMEVDHFDQEYDEGFRENMRIELGKNITTAVIDGRQFSPTLKQAVIQQSLIAQSQRESLLQTIDTEYDSLKYGLRRVREIKSDLEAEPTLSDLTLTQLFHYDCRLRRLKTQYEELLCDRQRDIHSNIGLQEMNGQHFLQTFLYDSFEVNFPVLATVIEQYKQLQKHQQAVYREIAYS